MESQDRNLSSACAGDWLEVQGVAGGPSRRGKIMEVLGAAGHPHFRVRWDEGHESIVYPADHEAIVHHPAGAIERSA
ncbi:MAG: DUF1918 domain-containing protein [Solirubrobacteraceae bacterium]